MKQKIVVETEVKNDMELAQASKALQTFAEKVPVADMTKLAEAIRKKPNLVKQALMFIG